MSEEIKVATEEVKRPSSSKTPLPTAGTFFGATSNIESTVPKCLYCTERHFSASCSKVTDINARKDILRREKRCFLCLKKGHLLDQCDKSCRNCKRRHHQSICQAKSPGESLNSHPLPPEEKSSQSKPETHVPTNTTRVNTANTETPTTHLTTATSRSKGSVLLQSATAVATNEDQSKSTTMRILFDSGSCDINTSTTLARRYLCITWRAIKRLCNKVSHFTVCLSYVVSEYSENPSQTKPSFFNLGFTSFVKNHWSKTKSYDDEIQESRDGLDITRSIPRVVSLLQTSKLYLRRPLTR